MTTVSILDTGGIAQAYFSEKNRDAVCDLFDFDDDETKQKFRKFHQNCCVTLRIMSSTETIDVEALEAHNIETHLLAKEIFPFMDRLDLCITFLYLGRFYMISDLKILVSNCSKYAI